MSAGNKKLTTYTLGPSAHSSLFQTHFFSNLKLLLSSREAYSLLNSFPSFILQNENLGSISERKMMRYRRKEMMLRVNHRKQLNQTNQNVSF